jgi:hypothetical protein
MYVCEEKKKEKKWMIVKGWGGDLLINDKWWGKVLAVIEND